MKLFKWHRLPASDYSNYLYPFRETKRRAMCLFLSLPDDGHGEYASQTQSDKKFIDRHFNKNPKKNISHKYIELIFTNYRKTI